MIVGRCGRDYDLFKEFYRINEITFITMCSVFIVSHPHHEPSYGWKRPKSRVTFGWNTSNSHKRKFIKRKGSYLNGTTVCNADIYFWGEYEAGSECTVVSRTRPKAIHDVLTPARGVSPLPQRALNTDPYVFGDHFKTICCGVRKNGGKYRPGDVILFGKVDYNAMQNKHLMYLDTVLVVKDDVPINYSMTNTQYYKAGIKPTNGKFISFYRGVPYSPGTTYFSFVPCRIDYTHDPLPILDLGKMSFNVSKRFRSWYAPPIPFTNNIWNMIINAVINSGWKLGIHVERI